MARPGTKPRIDESCFTPQTIPEAIRLHHELSEITGESKAWRIVGWLLDPDSLRGSGAHVRRSEYRTVLIELDKVRRAKGAFNGSGGKPQVEGQLTIDDALADEAA